MLMQFYSGSVQAAIPKDVRDYRLSECHVRPLAAFGESKYGRRVDPALAWESATRLQINPENATAALAFDVDNPKTMLPLWRWIEVLNEDLSMEDWQIIDGYRVNTDRYPHALLPSWIVRNELTGRFHAVYILKLPVHRNPSSSSSPQHFLDYIRRGIALTWHADLNYNGILTLNPVKPPTGYTTIWCRREPFTLRELARSLPRELPASSSTLAEDSRNCRTWEAARREAFRPANARRIIAGASSRDIVDRLNLTVSYDLGKTPMGENELAGISRSIDKCVRREWSETAFSAIQRHRAQLSAQVRCRVRVDRNRLTRFLYYHGGRSVPSIARHLRRHPKYGRPQTINGRTYGAQDVTERQLYRIVAEALSDDDEAHPHECTDTSTRETRGVPRGWDRGISLVTASNQARLPDMANVSPNGPGRHPQTGRQPEHPQKSRLRGPPEPFRGPLNGRHTLNEDHRFNEARRRASDVNALVASNWARLRETGDEAAIQSFAAMVRSSYGINVWKYLEA